MYGRAGRRIDGSFPSQPGPRRRVGPRRVALVAFVLLTAGTSHAAPSARRGGTAPCLKKEAASRVRALLAWNGTPAGLPVGPLGDIAIGRTEVRVRLLAEPGCVLVLRHPRATPAGILAVASTSVLVTGEGTGTSPACQRRIRAAAALIRDHDRGPSPWSRCGVPPTGRAPYAGMAPEARVGRPAPQGLAWPFWLLLGGGVLLVLILGLVMWRFRERLDSRALGSAAGTSGPTGVGRRGPALPRWAILGPVLTFVLIVWSGWDFGYNDEMTAGYGLTPYLFLAPPETHGAPAPCEAGLLRQEVRPVFSLCGSGVQRPLLNSAYSSALAYWPLAELGRQFPGLVGDPLRWLLLPVLALILWLFHGLLRDQGGPAPLAVLAPPLFLFFPISAIYTTPYLFEYLPQLLLLGAWALLARWNRTGALWSVVLACFLLGCAIQQKLTYALVVLPFLVAFGLFFGLRQLRAGQLALCAAVGSLPPLALLYANALYDPTMARLLQTPREALGPLDALLAFAHQALAPALEPGAGAARVGYLALLLALLGYAGWKNLRYWRGDAESRLPAFLGAILLFLVPALVLLYRSNPTSSPLLQILPLPVGVVAAAILDARAGIARRLGRAGRWLLPAFAVGLVLWGGQRWWVFRQWTVAHPAHLSRRAQHHVAARLEALGAHQPRMLSSYYHGVFEFLSQGRLRPVYLLERGFDPRREADWVALLRRTDRQRTDYLFCVERFRFDHATTPVPPIHEGFLRALRASGRLLEGRWAIGAGRGRPAFLLYRVAGASPRVRAAASAPGAR